MTAIINNQPMPATTQAIATAEGNGWSTGLCDCCDDLGVCCFAFWCLPCFMCKTADDYGECICLPLLEILGGHGIAGPSVSMAMRSGVRERYGIKGSICDDCCIFCCCYSCAWCQMSREIKKRKQPVVITTAHAVSVPQGQRRT
uniref:Cornifelin homolog A-like n=1 Tax=Geotrypetes seraphini TaxID=260995 RepID=A0A6P8PDS6_GEOSA|nr:cornifelin homolog A-like [Geotrypetes seraphini]